MSGAPVVDDSGLVAESPAKVMQLILLLDRSAREKGDDQGQDEDGSHGEARARRRRERGDYGASTAYTARRETN
jgi:hypothetical protein